MRGISQFGKPMRCDNLPGRLPVAVAFAAIAIAALPSVAQMHGPQTTTTVGGHLLAPPPSVLSVTGHLPPPLPSVTSIPNFGYTTYPYPYAPYYNGYHRGRRGYGYGYGYGSTGLSYAIPYYIPVDGYGYDYASGPELYSGPPIAPSDPALQMVAERPPTRYPAGNEYSAPPPQAQPSPLEQPATHEAKPNEPNVLIFRDGHQQEVSNYAIMGQTVYVFDKRTQKIALADLDVPATIKANDDRGLEFKIPVQKPAQKKSDLELKVPPDQNTTAPPNVAVALP